MDKLKWFGRWLRDEAFSQVFTSSWFWAIVATAVAAMLGHLQEFPAIWIYLSSLGAAAIVFALLAANSIRRSLSSPKYKIVVEAGVPVHWGKGDNQQFRPVVVLKNWGNFPIEVDSEKSVWSYDNRTGDSEAGIQTVSVVPPLGQLSLVGPIFTRPIPKKLDDCRADVNAKIAFSYGNISRRKYEYSQGYKIICWLNPENANETNSRIEQIGTGRYA